VAAVLADSGLDPALLVLEITESVMVQDSDATAARLAELKGLGVRLAIDDFGTGYSSLSYLRRFPVDIHKIDKSFVDAVAADGSETALVRGIVSMGRALHLNTVAEGIEQAEQAERLRLLGCDTGQGYLFARPMPAAEIEGLLSGEEGAAGRSRPPHAA
jgi:EAL domain-containing protein (putative c-di-GMP-specific phosphodiesterase class I)